MTEQELNEAIQQFFLQPPETGPGPGNVRSIMFLLRRDLRDLSIPEQRQPTDNDKMTAPVLACGSMAIGLEVLGRIWCGKNKPIQRELKAAYQTLLKADAIVANLLVMFRNAVMHGYQLEHHGNDGITYRFSLGDHVGWTLWFEERDRGGKKEHHLNCWELRQHFLKAIEDWYAILRNPANTDERARFEKVLPYLKPYQMVTSPVSTKTTT